MMDPFSSTSFGENERFFSHSFHERIDEIDQIANEPNHSTF